MAVSGSRAICEVKELWDMDLDGAPYAFTPMCDSNPDTEGFRFWKQGSRARAAAWDRGERPAGRAELRVLKRGHLGACSVRRNRYRSGMVRYGP